MHRLFHCIIGAAFALAFALPATVEAQTRPWPSKSIRMVVNFAAGGTTDVIARSMAQGLAAALGQPVIVDNRVGASGNIGLELVAKSAPDGYTLLHSSDGPILLNPHLFKMEVNVARDLLPVAPTAGAALFLIARPGVPSRNLAEFAYARANPESSTTVPRAAARCGIAIEMLMSTAKFKAVHATRSQVPWISSAPCGLHGGSCAAIPHVKSGTHLLVCRPARSPMFPDAPTLIEAGTNVELAWLSGVYAPAGTPRAIVMRLNNEIGRIMRSPEAKAQLDAMASEATPPMTPEQFAAHQQRARDRFGAVVREAGIRSN
jgi:tripartite-type tricarboxylate transporter receptor subunit TctC